ncbi:unnamed protein product [Sphagnum jensenii]|uniref:Uncharacterized protein n=1 Tax=Sphagnum jensenii TaxID=128206 RepID=A0ABP1B8B7_9BRYO
MAPRAPVTSPPARNTNNNNDDDDNSNNNPRVRKSYTMTKHREGWSKAENNRFIEGFFLYKRDWKKIQSHVATKTIIQIRSHAQKFILKCEREGMGYLIPPPRPKRKALHPYPHKTPTKKAAVRIDEEEEETQRGSGYMVIPYDHPEFISDLSANSSFQSASPSLPNGSDNNGIQLHDAWQDSIDFSKVYAFLSTLFHCVMNPGDYLDRRLKQMCSIEQAITLRLLRNIVKSMEPMHFKAWIEVLDGLHEMHLMMDGPAADPKFVPEASFEAESNDPLEVETNLWDMMIFGEEGNDSMMVETNLWAETEIGVA